MNENTLVKSGETVVMTVFQRSKDGITFQVKVSSAIEDLLQGWGSGEKQPVAAFGRYWTPRTKEQTLNVWSLGVNPGIVPVNDRLAFRIDQVGSPLLAMQGPQEVINLSFLRLVGASEGDGVTFNLKGVAWSPDEARRVQELVKSACRQFYVSYLKPVHVVVRVLTEEVKPGGSLTIG